jgi:hypothetical protein
MGEHLCEEVALSTLAEDFIVIFTANTVVAL